MAGKFVDGNNLKRAIDYVVNGTYGNLAKQDGSYDLLRVGEAEVANNLTPYDESAGADQDDPFLFQATGTANGTQSDFATGSYCQLKEKRGNSVVVNQLAKEINSTNWSFSRTASSNISDGIATFTANDTAGGVYMPSGVRPSAIPNHKYLISAKVKLTTGNTDVRLIADTSVISYTNTISTTNWQDLFLIANYNYNSQLMCAVWDYRTSDWDAIQVKDIICIDLTQWFGSNDAIPQDLLDNPSHFSWYYNGSLAYNEGTLVNANSRYIKCIGRQQWDEEWEVGYINQTNGENQSANDAMRSKNYILAIPNKMYYVFAPNHNNSNNRIIVYFYDKDKNFIFGDGLDNLYSENDYGKGYFIVPSNAIYFRFATANLSTPVTYNNDITISLYYEGESGYDQYYPYEVLTNNDTGNETLLAFDTKDPNGTIHRNTVEFDLKELTWTYESQNKQFYSEIVFDSNYRSTDVKCNKYVQYDYDGIGLSTPHTRGIISGRIYIIDESLNGEGTAITGIMQCKTDTPTTEQGTPFSENLVIDDFGSMEFSGTSGVPQGNLIFYPVDYKAFIDTLYDYTEGTPSDIALKSDLASDKSELQGVDSELKNAIGGTLRQCLCVKESLSFENTDVVDLGSLSPSYNSSWNCWQFTLISNIKAATSNSTPAKILASNMKTVAASGYTTSHANYTVALNTSGQLFVDNGSSTIPPKGVLLAYEKAE